MGLNYIVGRNAAGPGNRSGRDFVDCLWQGKKPLVGEVDGLRITEILAAVEEWAKTGQPVKVKRNDV